MREIKFRAYYKKSPLGGPEWDETTVGLHEVVALKWREWFGNGVLSDSFGVNLRRDDSPKSGHVWVTAAEVELMEWTGLKDKNGKEIYEGDIIKYIGFGKEYIREVVWDEQDAKFAVKIHSDYFMDHFPVGQTGIEVIGNIYQHKHLLK